jgi:hypothetical protein
MTRNTIHSGVQNYILFKKIETTGMWRHLPHARCARDALKEVAKILRFMMRLDLGVPLESGCMFHGSAIWDCF